MTKDKLIGTAYVNIIKDEKGEIKFAYGYEMNKEKVSLNDISMFLSFLDTLRSRAEHDFKDRLDVSEKKFSIEKE